MDTGNNSRLRTLTGLTAALASVGYVARTPETLAVVQALAYAGSGMPAILLEGEPGVGKTALAEAVAAVIGCPLVFAQGHSWLSADDLFTGVHVPSAVAGDAAHVELPGVLLQAARASQAGRVVVLLDEWDKTPDRCDALLLDVLQSGRVPTAPGVHERIRPDRALIFVGANARRELDGALYRRCARVRMAPLPVEQQERLLLERTAALGASPGLVRVAWRAAREVAEAEGNSALSIQEGENLLHGLLTLAEGPAHVQVLLAQWAARRADGERVAASGRGAALARDVWAQLARTPRARVA